jgi:multidrug transporter EmrE-like cation transporter
MTSDLLLSVGVGACWGITDSYVRVGVLKAKSKRPTEINRLLTRLLGSHWASLLVTPSFIIPTLLNTAASIFLVQQLAKSQVHVATPVANAVSIAMNAATASLVLGENMKWRLLVPGLMCVAGGVALVAQ